MPRKKPAEKTEDSGTLRLSIGAVPNETDPGIAELQIHGNISGVTLDVKINSPKGGRALLVLLDRVMNALGPPKDEEKHD